MQGGTVMAAIGLTACGGGGGGDDAAEAAQAVRLEAQAAARGSPRKKATPAALLPDAPVSVGTLAFQVEFTDPAAPLLQPQGGPFNPYYVYYGGDAQPDGPAGYRWWPDELQAYTTALYPAAPWNPLSVASDLLSVRARPSGAGEPASPQPYLSGCLETSLGAFWDPPATRSARTGFEQKYGYWEIRARVPRTRGVWPAFWLNGGKPDPQSAQGELDVFEMIGDGVVYQTAHDWWAATHVIESVGIQPGFDHAAGFHTYGLHWTASEIAWYVDGVATHRASAALVARYRDLCGPMFLVMNVAVGGTWAGAPDPATAWPVSLDVDYVRAWTAA